MLGFAIAENIVGVSWFTQMEYSYLTGKEQLRYSISDGVLCVATASGMSIRLCLTDSGVTVKKMRTFSRLFRMGFAGFAVPLFTFSMIAARDGVHAATQQMAVLDLSNIILMVLFVVGVLLSAIHWRPIRGYRYNSGVDGINVWRDPVSGELFDQFIAEVNENISRK